MGDVVDIEEQMPHVVREVICVRCCTRWVSVAPQATRLKDYECQNCGSGYIICTGQEISDG